MLVPPSDNTRHPPKKTPLPIAARTPPRWHFIQWTRKRSCEDYLLKSPKKCGSLQLVYYIDNKNNHYPPEGVGKQLLRTHARGTPSTLHLGLYARSRQVSQTRPLLCWGTVLGPDSSEKNSHRTQAFPILCQRHVESLPSACCLKRRGREPATSESVNRRVRGVGPWPFWSGRISPETIAASWSISTQSAAGNSARRRLVAANDPWQTTAELCSRPAIRQRLAIEWPAQRTRTGDRQKLVGAISKVEEPRGVRRE